jgi:hypothetical protein
MTAPLEKRIKKRRFLGARAALCGFCFGLGCDFSYGFWWGCGCHGVSDPRAYGQYGYEGYGDWGGDEPVLDVFGRAEVYDVGDVGVVEEQQADEG